jgi:hypothetical protein
MKKLIAIAFTLALGIASAKSVSFRLYEDSLLNGKTFKAGAAKLILDGEHAVLVQGKTAAVVSVRQQDASETFSKQAIRYETANGKLEIKEFRIKGANYKLVVD